MTCWVPILVLLAGAPPAEAGPLGARDAAGADDAAVLAALLADAPGRVRLALAPGRPRLVRLLADGTFARPRGDGPATPPCVADTCQPRVSVPGYDRPVSMRGKRTELALNLLDRARIEPLATAVWFLAATGVRLDYTPAQLDGGGGLETGRGGWGHLQVLLRWRIDARNAPVWPVRHR